MFWERLRYIFVGNTFIGSDCIALMREQMMNNGLEKMRKEASETLFGVLSWYLLGRTKQNHDRLQQGQVVSGSRIQCKISQM
jgi:hypothetical protein